MINKEGEINIGAYIIYIIKKLYGIIVLLMGTEAIIPVIRENMGVNYGNLQVDYVTRYIWITIYFVTIILILSNWKIFFEVVFANKLIWMIFAFTIISVAWSATPSITIRKCVALFFTQIIGIYLYSEFGLEGVLDILKWTAMISIILSFIFSSFLPAYGIQNEDGYFGVWRGAYINKNLFGQNMLIFTLLWMVIFLEKVKLHKSKYILPFVFMILSAYLLVKSESKTALVVCLIILCSIPICLIVRRNLILAIGLFFSAFTIVVIFYFNNFGMIGKLLASMGKDATLTGRTDIWGYVIQAVKIKPLLGYGYGAFFQGFNGPSRFLCNLIGLPISEAHNGYLGIALDLGIVGLSIFVLSLIKNVIDTLVYQSRYNSYFVMFPFIYMMYFLVFNVAESVVVSQNQISWIMYSFIATYISCKSKNKVILNEGEVEQLALN